MAAAASDDAGLRPEAEGALPGPLPEALPRELAELGLSPYEARILLALLQLGSATTLQLARLSRVPRTSTYQVLEELSAKRLAERLPGGGPAVWASPGLDDVLERLDATQEERLRQHRSRSARVREMLVELLPESPSVALPYVHFLHGAVQVKRVYEQMLGEATCELVMFTRPPYTWALGKPNPVVLETLTRGIRARVLYQASQWADPAAEAFRAEMQAYHDAGVEARLAEDLPIKLTVVDRRVTLIVMTDPVSVESGYPTTLHVEHPGFSAVQADAFEQRWAAARPLMEATRWRGTERPGA